MTNLSTYTRCGISRIQGLAEPFRKVIAEFSKFGVVGLIAMVIDIGLFNLLLYAGPAGLFDHRPLTAKAVSVVVATTVSYSLNRSWTFADRSRTGVVREYVLFVVLNVIALLIALATLWFSHYALGLTSPLADNLSANVVGLALGTAFRFWSYRKWVFPESEGLDSLETTDEINIPAPAIPAAEVFETGSITTACALGPARTAALVPLAFIQSCVLPEHMDERFQIREPVEELVP